MHSDFYTVLLHPISVVLLRDFARGQVLAHNATELVQVMGLAGIVLLHSALAK